MHRSRNRRVRGLALGAVVSSVALLLSLGHPVRADDDPVAEPPVSTGEVGGAVVAVGPPPVPATTVVVAVGPPPVPPTTVSVAVGPPPVPPTTVVVAVGPPPVPPTTAAPAPDLPNSPSVQAGRISDQSRPVLGVRQSVTVAIDVTDVIADMISTVESAVALIDSRL